MSKNYLFTKKGKKQFNKLSAQDKQVVAEVAIADAVEKALSKYIPDAILCGRRLALQGLYEKYVKEIDNGSLDDGEKQIITDKILSDIRIGHVEYEKAMGLREEEDGK